jgi:hypothetical protein
VSAVVESTFNFSKLGEHSYQLLGKPMILLPQSLQLRSVVGIRSSTAGHSIRRLIVAASAVHWFFVIALVSTPATSGRCSTSLTVAIWIELRRVELRCAHAVIAISAGVALQHAVQIAIHCA